MSIIGEAILNVSIEMLLKTLASTEFWQFSSQKQIRKDLNQWKKTLLKIKAVLDDADEKQVREESVKIWLGELRNLAYDVEDILDEFATEAFHRKLFHEADQASTSTVRKLVPSCFSNSSPRTLKFNWKIVSQMKEITARLQDIATQKDLLGLKEYSALRSIKVRQSLPTTCLVNEAKVYGREKDQEAIVELLLRDDLSTDDGVSIIPIIGMGGVGKTTLAQLAYNDARLEGRFDLKAWICVSEEFDVIRITKSMLRSIDIKIDDDNDLNKLQVESKKQLYKKKFLLVLDDIWNENPNYWNLLRRPFEGSSPGSKIIVTARNQGVATLMGTLPAYQLKKLSNEACLCVFTRYSLGRTDFIMHQHLKEIGEEIVKRCNGLPLAAETLGGLLRGKDDRNDWEDVLNCKIWDLSEERSDLLPALRVSYYYLPSYLKRCFAYCSIFPKDYEFHKEEIILLWMAEGLLQHQNDKKQMEDLGNEFFHDLKSRSFFQQSSRNMSKFTMHDLINDLAQWAAGEICLRMDNKFDSDIKEEVSNNLRYFSYIRGEYDGVKNFKAICDAKRLRTFLPVCLSSVYDRQDSFLTGHILHMLPKLRYLRALSLRGYLIFELPNTIGELINLRYLDISYTKIETLPESIGTLYNLETLLLENCSHLKKLCADMGNLVNLHHLNNSGAHALEKMPQGIGNLTGLLKLPYFVVGKDSGSTLGELRSMKHIRERLCISGLQNVDTKNAIKADLNSKKELNVLELKWTSRNGDVGEQTHVLDMLRPHQNLKELVISGYRGTRFPFWLGDSSFSNLVLLKLEDCSECTVLPSVGQLPLLKHLVIRGMTGVKRVSLEFYTCSKPFPSLETLCFECMREWEDWLPHGPDQNAEVFPHLLELSIIECPKLEGRLPECLPSLERLVIRSCEQLLLSVPILPKLCRLEIKGCKKLEQRSAIDFSSLNSVVLSDISSQFCPTEWFTRGLSKVEELRIVGCKYLISLRQSVIELPQDNSSLHRLVFECCPQLLCLVTEEEEEQQRQGFPRRLQYLELNERECFVKLTQTLRSLSFLTEISIKHCPELVSFPETGMPPQLRIIKIEECNALKSLPEAWMSSSNTNLESLSIKNCDSLTFIARVQLPPNLKRLVIIYCRNLLTLVDEEADQIMHREITIGGNTSCLEYMKILACESLTSLWSKSELPTTLEHIELLQCFNLASLSSSGNLPKALKYLIICSCQRLERIAERLQNHTSLETIFIASCFSLKFLPEDMHKLCHLQEITISMCDKLEALPNCLHTLASLESLSLYACPSVVSFPDKGLPTSLTFLCIKEVEICNQLFDWGLHRLTSLRELRIRHGDLVSFPQEEIGMMLPTSLTRLELENFPKLQRLSSSIQNLTSLEQLYLSDCYELKSFPRKGLPSSLLKLHIDGCPMLKQRCEKDTGDCWPMIAHIPYICLDLDFIPGYGPPRSIVNSPYLWSGRQNLALFENLSDE